MMRGSNRAFSICGENNAVRVAAQGEVSKAVRSKQPAHDGAHDGDDEGIHHHCFELWGR